MDNIRKKQLLEAYRNRRPEMGIISFRCLATGEAFLSISKDTKADYNGTRFKLSFNSYPNKQLQQLWNQYGEAGFAFSVIEVLKYEDPTTDYTAELEALREKHLAKDSKARRLWK